MGWVTDHPPSRAEIGSCIQCGLCLPHCPTFRLTGRETASPRGRLTAMAAVADGIVPLDRTFTDMLDFCLGCRACEVACPSLVPYGRLLEQAREEVVAASGGSRMRAILWGRAVDSSPLLGIGSVALGLAQRVGLPRWVPGSVGRAARGVRPLAGRPPSRKGRTFPSEGEQRGVVGLLAGCVMDHWFRPVHEATIGVLCRAGYTVVVPDDQACCGALAAHAGVGDEARRLATINLAAFAEVDLVVADAAGCGAHLKEYAHVVGRGLPVADVTEVVARAIGEGHLPRSTVDRGRVGVQDPCHLRHAQRITAEPRLMLEAAGYQPVDVDPSGMCCGAAGAWSIAHPTEAARLGTIKAEQVHGLDVEVVASANPGCEMQLRSHTGGNIRIAHPIELYWEAIDG